MRNLFVLVLFFFSISFALAQSSPLKAGFDKDEYLEMLKISSHQRDTVYDPSYMPPSRFERIYHSEVIGLDNRWGLWVSDDKVAVLSVRGTVMTLTSWLENFYAAMAPASGSLKLEDKFTFNYHLADHPQAAVHIGWLIGTAYLSRDMLPRIDALYEKGFRDIIIMGHSQGGAITYLLTSHLKQLQRDGRLPSDIRFKTYASAAPKPGNMHYAYAYEFDTRGGWAFNVVNAADWVPEGPFSIQMMDDFNPLNPFIISDDAIKSVGFPKSLGLRYTFNHLKRPPAKASKRYQRYLGKKLGKYIRKTLPEYEDPIYYPSANYMRAGIPIILQPDEAYFEAFPNVEKEIWVNHMLEAYMHLTEKLY